MEHNDIGNAFDEQWIAHWTTYWKFLFDSGKKMTMMCGNNVMMETCNNHERRHTMSGNFVFCRFKLCNQKHCKDIWRYRHGVHISKFRNICDDAVDLEKMCEFVEMQNYLLNISTCKIKQFVFYMNCVFHKHHQNFVQTSVKTMLINAICEYYANHENFTENMRFSNVELVFADEYITASIAKY